MKIVKNSKKKVGQEIPEKLRPLESLAKETSKEEFIRIIDKSVESKKRTPSEQQLVNSLLYLEELKLPSPAIENFWKLIKNYEEKT